MTDTTSEVYFVVELVSPHHTDYSTVHLFNAELTSGQQPSFETSAASDSLSPEKEEKQLNDKSHSLQNQPILSF